MTIQYLISSCFMLAILIIFVKKGGSDIRQPRSRRIYLWLLAFIIAYVIIDAFFLLFYISPSNVTGYRIITFVFYIIYVLMPFVWHIFVRNFVGGSYPKIIQRLEYIPLLLLFGMILYNIPSRTLWYITATSDYQRGSWFTAFSILNMFYYVDSLFHAVVITYKKRQTSEPYLLQSVFISFIPFVGIVLNAFVIPINIMYPVQPFCIVLVAILAYFFMADHETQILQAQYQKKLKDALHQEKIATKQIIEANKIKAKFLANISHDIRTPLNAILGFSNIIAKDPSDIEAVTNANEKIQVSGDILLTLVNEVLDFNRLENGKLEIHPISTDLRNLGKELETMFTHGMQRAQITFTITNHIHTSQVLCDIGKVREILVNLIGNAQKFTPKGGKVSLTIEEQENHQYCFIVEDTGIGMSQTFQNHMFEAFEREKSYTETNIAGTGLGLAIVKELVDLMHGSIKVQSKLHKGTTFWITLFLPPNEKALQHQITHKESTTNIQGVHILLAEDNELNREIAETILSEEGVIVTTAKNGKEALEQFTNAPIHSFDLILMDVMMPVMDGIEATKQIRNSNRTDAKNIPIFAITANAQSEDIQKYIHAGMNEHFRKPLNFESLIQTIVQYTKNNN